LLLLRLLNPLPSCRANITIDGTPLHTLNHSALRDRIITIPQEPAFLPDGTSFRSNLDPYGLADEPECRRALESVGLWSVAQRQGGLHAGLSAGSLSQGQKQLFSLARAVLRRRVRAAKQLLTRGGGLAGETSFGGGGILLVDEVSSTVDAETEEQMQTVIHREFEGYTVVMVTHRLEMLRGFDRVVVMEKGAIVEVGPPEDMMGRDGGVFRHCGR